MLYTVSQIAIQSAILNASLFVKTTLFEFKDNNRIFLGALIFQILYGSCNLPSSQTFLETIFTDFYKEKSCVSHLMIKPTKRPLRPAKTRISLGICPVSSVFAVRSVGS